MKKIKWKILITTCLLCLVPIVLGIAVYDQLPAQMAIHFNLKNEPDRYAAKNFVLFALPFLMLFLQAFCCAITDINAAKKGGSKKFELAIKLIVPVMTFVIYTATIGYAFDSATDIRRIAIFIVGFIFVILGNYMPKIGYTGVNFGKIPPDKSGKFKRLIGYETVGLGILFFISILLPPFASVAVLILLFPYIVINCIYAVYLRKNG